MNSDSSRQFAIEVGKGPRGIAVSKDGSRVYVCNYISGDVSVIDTKDRRVIATIKVGEYPQRVALSPDESLAFVTNYGSRSISVVSTQTLKCVRDIDVGAHPWGIVVSPDGKFVYTHVRGDQSLAILETDTYTVSHASVSHSECQDIGISPDGLKLYLSGHGKEGNHLIEKLTVIDSQTHHILAQVRTPQFPWWVSVNPENGKVYVMCQHERKIAVIDAAFQIEVFDSVYTEGQLAFGGKYAYLLDYSANAVAVIDTETHQVIHNIDIDGPVSPWNVVYAKPGVLYISDYANNTARVITFPA
jgi:YVTN family beta-propeller protein